MMHALITMGGVGVGRLGRGSLTRAPAIFLLTVFIRVWVGSKPALELCYEA